MACRTGDVRRVYDAFLVWRRRTRGPAGLAPLAIELEQALFGGDVGRVWTAENARDFDAKLRVLRQEQERAQGRYAQRTLPPLNPLFD